jgi:hypothetical protein
MRVFWVRRPAEFGALPDPLLLTNRINPQKGSESLFCFAERLPAGIAMRLTRHYLLVDLVNSCEAPEARQ